MVRKRNYRKSAAVSVSDSRFTEVESELQDAINLQCLTASLLKRFQYMEGDGIICIIDGLYHECEVLGPWSAIRQEHAGPVPGDMALSVEEDMYIPTYIVYCPGLNVEQEIPENELILRDASDPTSRFGLLYAHEFNVRVCEIKRMPEARLQKGVWLMGKDLYEICSRQWKREKGQSFEEYCGRTFIPTMVTLQ